MNLKQIFYEAKNGSSGAVKTLYYYLSDRCLALCICIVKNEADAEERMLDGFQHFFSSIHHYNFESDAALFGCVRRIMVNECIIQIRKTRILEIEREPVEYDLVLDQDGLEQLTVKEIYKMIGQLPLGARMVFLMHATEGMQHDEIADKLGISIGTSKSQFARAKAKLQKSLSHLKESHE